MSWGLSPSPRPLSGSLLVIDTSRMTGLASQVSVATIVTVIATSLWFEGKSCAGDTLTDRFGGVVSTTARWVSLSSGLRERIDDAQDIRLLGPDPERLLGHQRTRDSRRRS